MFYCGVGWHAVDTLYHRSSKNTLLFIGLCTVLCDIIQTIYVPDKDYVWSEPSTPPSPQCPLSQDPSLTEDNSTEAEDKSDSAGMLNFTYPVSTFALCCDRL